MDMKHTIEQPIKQRVWVASSRGAKAAVDVYVEPAASEAVRRPAIVICPGGGYSFCSEREAEPVALRFLAEGFNTFVVWYRVNAAGDEEEFAQSETMCYSKAKDHTFPLPQHDAAAAIAYVRSHAKEHHTDPDRIAVMGFSAGGHLAASVCGLWNREELWQEIGCTPEDVRPNAAVLCYPVIVSDEDAHRGSFEHLSGTKDVRAHGQYDVLNMVGEHYPPTFLWHTFADESVPVRNSLRMAMALSHAGVRTEVHIFPEGRHGLSLADRTTCPPDNPSLYQPECTIWVSMAARFLNS